MPYIQRNSPFKGLKETLEKAGNKIVGKGASKAAGKGVKAGAKKMFKRGIISKSAAKGAGRLVPGVGWGLLGKDAMKGMMKAKAKGYAKLKKGTGKRLEAGAYGMQAGRKGGKKVRGTFFGSMK